MGKLRSKRRHNTRRQHRHKTHRRHQKTRRQNRHKTRSIQNRRKRKRKQKKNVSDKEKGAGFINMSKMGSKLGSLFFKYGMNKNNPVYPYFAEAEEDKKNSLNEEEKQKVSHELQQYDQQTRKRLICVQEKLFN